MFKLVLLCLLAADPKAVITGPAHAEPKVAVLIDITGTVSEIPPTFKFLSGPEKLTIQPLYADPTKPIAAYGRLVAREVGTYTFAVYAWGKVEAGKPPEFDVAKYEITVGAIPLPPVPPPDDPLKPTPPGPKPPPIPLPDPVTGPTDPAIRKAAAEWYSVHIADYKAGIAKIAATNIGYNDLMKAQKDNIKTYGTTLGLAIDAVVKPLVSQADGSFLNKDEAKYAYTVVANSLQAGMRDALLKNP